jgi:hypothetical protein
VARQAGEWVDAGETVVRLVRLDEYSVELSIEPEVRETDSDLADLMDAAVSIEVEVAPGRPTELAARIVGVDAETPAGNRLIRAVVQNHPDQGHGWLRPGMAATLRLRR